LAHNRCGGGAAHPDLMALCASGRIGGFGPLSGTGRIVTAALASLGLAALGTTLLGREARQAGDSAASEKRALAAEPPAQAAADG
jgi:hypothetical protein